MEELFDEMHAEMKQLLSGLSHRINSRHGKVANVSWQQGLIWYIKNVL